MKSHKRKIMLGCPFEITLVWWMNDVTKPTCYVFPRITMIQLKTPANIQNTMSKIVMGYLLTKLSRQWIWTGVMVLTRYDRIARQTRPRILSFWTPRLKRLHWDRIVRAGRILRALHWKQRSHVLTYLISKIKNAKKLRMGLFLLSMVLCQYRALSFSISLCIVVKKLLFHSGCSSEITRTLQFWNCTFKFPGKRNFVCIMRSREVNGSFV